jgi:hypothetical protein
MKNALALISMIFLLSITAKAQEKTTMNVNDLNSSIEKYIKKNYEGYKITEAFKYALVYKMNVKKADTTVALVFNEKGAFLYKKTEADKSKVSLQTRTTIALEDVESNIPKYIKKNYAGYKLTEAYRYDEVYTTKIVKGADHQTLVFDKDGKFIKKETAGMPDQHTAHEMKTDSIK